MFVSVNENIMYIGALICSLTILMEPIKHHGQYFSAIVQIRMLIAHFNSANYYLLYSE